MPTNRHRPRRHSLSSGDESFHPHPAKPDGLPRQDSRRRARLPRSKSTSNVFDAFSRPPGTTEHDMSNIALEQTDIVSLRELVQFLRTTGPPHDRATAHDECLKLSGSAQPRRWSLQSLRRNKRLKVQRHSLQSHLPESAVPGTTAEGHRYIAILTPVLKNNNVDGPWFRSQYPIFLPQSPPPTSHGEWLERSSSKEASFLKAESEIAAGGLREFHPSMASFVEKDYDYLPNVPDAEGANTGASSNTISTDHLLRAMLNTVEEGFEYDRGASLKQSDIQRGPGVEQLRQPLNIQMPLPLVTVDKEETSRSDGVWEDAPERNRLPGQSHSPIPPHNGGSPRSPGRYSRRPANILVQKTLGVPKKNLLPESPGFPNMLATITFPSPPKGSQPSSPASNTPSIVDSPRPMVQPRTSSRRACTSTSVSAASLDEIVMQKRPNSRYAKSERPAQVGTMPNSCTTVEAPSASHSPTKPTMRPPAEHLSSPEDVVNSGTDQGLIDLSASTGPAYDGSVIPSCGGGEECQRESQASQLTATTDSYRQSFTCGSSRSSSVSDASTRSRSTVTPQKTYSEETEGSRHVNLATSERYTTTEDLKSRPNSASKESVSLIETQNPELVRDHGASKRPSLWLSTTNIEANPQPRSIIERRLARKAKVREYKMRDLDASRVEAVDSPILGYFAPNLPQVPKPLVKGSSPLVYSSRRSSTLSTTTTASEASNELHRNSDANVPANLHHGLLLNLDKSQMEEATKVVLPPLSGPLKMSPVIVTDIEPIYPPTPHWHTSGITMSPIMVVADVESRPGSPTLRFSALARPESSSPRSMVRPKPLKIASQSRQKSHLVTMSRNPSTGAIERTALGPMDSKFNRRSLIAMPTPPMSPEAIQLSRRLSLPPAQLNIPITPRDGILASRRQDWHSSHATERELENKLRSVTLKERVLREKLQKEKEITDIVAKTVGPPQREAVYDEPSPLSLKHHNAEHLEKRLRRLERNNDAWLCAMKPLLEAMAKTLDDMRQDERCSSLRMSDFIIDIDAEGGQLSYNQKTRYGEKKSVPTLLHNSGRVESGGNAHNVSSPIVLASVPQKLDRSGVPDKHAASTNLTNQGPSGGEKAPSTIPQGMVGSLSILQELESWANETTQGHMMQQKAMMGDILNGLSTPSSETINAELTGTSLPCSSGKTTSLARGDTPRTCTGATGAAQSGSVAEVKEPSDWSDLDPLIQELGNKTHKPWDSGHKESSIIDQDAGGSRSGVNALNPLMRELMSASQLSAEEVMNVG
ncbi:hypothetical protein HD806DRAFT_540516 [Xylariaceae sp. AK1471]|nr:hypothetical protein HD806DRAFT_540516 [Xylariaceae sp. AK1471]